MDVLYVLRLHNDKWYIGRSSNLERRFEQHMKGEGAKWTSLHQAINIHESRPLVSDEDEDLLTLEYMKQYGIYNVRGGQFCAVELKPWHVKEIKKRLEVKEVKIVDEVKVVEEEKVIEMVQISQEEIEEQKKIEAQIRMENAILQHEQDEIRAEIKKQKAEAENKDVLNKILSNTEQSFKKISNEFTNPDSDLLSGRWFKKLFR